MKQTLRRDCVRVPSTSSKEQAHHPPHVSWGCAVLLGSQHGRHRKLPNTKDHFVEKEPSKHPLSSLLFLQVSILPHSRAGAMKTRDSAPIQNIAQSCSDWKGCLGEGEHSDPYNPQTQEGSIFKVFTCSKSSDKKYFQVNPHLTIILNYREL